MPSRSIEQLHPDIRPLCYRFLATCKERGFDVLVTCTYRDTAEQDALYTIGRTLPGRRVTNARGGQSLHNITVGGVPASRAFDVVPLRLGKPVWGTTGVDLALWQRIGEIGQACGLEWAGAWTRFREFPHFQLREKLRQA